MAGTCDVGVIGLAVMGSNLALNIADKGFEVAVFNRTYAKTQEFLKKNEGYKNLKGFETMKEFAAALKKPRRALILVQAGGPTDSTIQQLSEVFEKMTSLLIQAMLTSRTNRSVPRTWKPKDFASLAWESAVERRVHAKVLPFFLVAPRVSGQTSRMSSRPPLLRQLMVALAQS
jgi:hypothetical protein